MSTFFRAFVLMVMVLQSVQLSGCGFRLRGSADYPMKQVFIESVSAPRMAYVLTRELQNANLTIAESKNNAEVIVILSHEILDRRTLSVSSFTGKLEEVELNYRIHLSAKKATGEVLIEPQLISLLRDYQFEETAVLAKADEEIMLGEELFREALVQIMRRLQMLRVGE